MNNRITVRRFHRRADFEKKIKSLGEPDCFLFNKASNGNPVDVLHHKVRPAVIHRPRVHESRNIRMIEASQDLALGAEPTNNIFGRSATIQYFDRYLLLEISIRACCQIDRSHPAPTNFPNNDISADSSPDFRKVFPRNRSLQTLGTFFEWIRFVRLGHEGFNLVQEIDIIRAGAANYGTSS